MNANGVSGSPVLTAKDLKIRAERDVTEIAARFPAAGKGVAADWVEYGCGLLPFVMAPGNDRSGEFYVYGRQRGSFWLLTLPSQVFGGCPAAEMRLKIRDFRLLDFAQDPALLVAQEPG